MFPVQMTDRELEIVAAFIKEGSFSKDARKRVREALKNGAKPMSASNLSNFLSSLQKKGFLIGTGRNDLRVHPKILPLSPKNQKYNFELNCNESESLEKDGRDS